MKPSATLALSALLSFVVAQPMVEKRDDATITVTDVVVVVTDVTVTVGGPSTPPAAATTKHAGHIAYHAQGKAEALAKPSSAPAPAPVQPPAQPPVVEQKNAAPPASSAPAAPPPAGSSPEQIQEAEDAKQEAINSQQKQADFAHQSQMNALQNGGNTAAPAAAAPAPPATPAPQAPAQAPAPPSSGSGSSGGSSGGSYSGDVTIYNDQGFGACGWSNDTNSEDFFALAHVMFGDYTNNAPGPNKNAFCGRMASINVNGKKYSGMLTDKCGGCDGASIDLSQHLFSQIYPNEPPGNGRFHNVPWEFTSGPIYSPA